MKGLLHRHRIVLIIQAGAILVGASAPSITAAVVATLCLSAAGVGIEEGFEISRRRKDGA